jgi:hypothetical protein
VGKSSAAFRLFVAGAALTLTLGLAGSANASPTQTFSFLGGKSGKTIQAKVSTDSGGSFSGLFGVGVYRGTLSNVVGELELFCTDLHHAVGSPFTTLAMLGKIVDPAEALSAQGYYDDGVGSGGGLYSAMTAADYDPQAVGGLVPFSTVAERVNAVAYLVHAYLNSGASKETLGKVQLAIWDIVNDGGDGASAGAFQAKDGADVAFDLSAILTEASGWKGFAVRRPEWIQAPRLGDPPKPSDHVQDFAYDPVPEPAFYQMAALLTLGGLGLLRRRGKKS